MKESPSERTGDAWNDVQVLFYSGYRGEEAPRAVIMDGREYRIEEVLTRERVLDSKTGETREVFVCRISGGRVRIEKTGGKAWTAVLLGI
jgi:hypothetical protein